MNLEQTIAFILLLLTAGCGNIAGPKGDQGTQGYTGQAGAAGPAGPSGLNGADGTQITIVPLCPGVSNYGTFVEVAECINGKLYGVYSLNNGFLTYLPAGAYSSNAVGSACNFTVSGCIVTH